MSADLLVVSADILLSRCMYASLQTFFTEAYERQRAFTLTRNMWRSRTRVVRVVNVNKTLLVWAWNWLTLDYFYCVASKSLTLPRRQLRLLKFNNYYFIDIKRRARAKFLFCSKKTLNSQTVMFLPLIVSIYQSLKPERVYVLFFFC